MTSRIRGLTDSVVRSTRITGFSLIELMVTLGIAALLLMFAVPAFQDATLGSKLSSYANTMVAFVNTGRSEAIKRNAPIKMCVSTNGTACATGGWEQGWILFRDVNDNDTVNTDDVLIQRQEALAAGFKMTPSASTAKVVFLPTGVGVTQVTLTVCRATPSTGKQERVLTISTTGRTNVTRTTTGVCT